MGKAIISHLKNFEAGQICSNFEDENKLIKSLNVSQP
jgi:hypothetical protein